MGAVIFFTVAAGVFDAAWFRHPKNEVIGLAAMLLSIIMVFYLLILVMPVVS